MPEISSNNSKSQLLSSNNSEATGMGWLLPLLLLVLAAGLFLYLLNGTGNSSLQVAQQFITADDTSSNKQAIQENDPAAHNRVQIKLPDHSFITGAKDGIEYHLVEFMNNKKDTINKNRWFNFDNISFENDDSMLTSSSLQQIQNIVSILKAYPKMKIKIGAFTEKTNDEVADLELTQQQANAVFIALRKAGANTAQITSVEGYGSAYAKAPSSGSINEKMKDRKISINVTEK